MLVQCVTVENYSGRAEWIKDLQLPGGRARFEPGATMQIPYGVWLRVRRKTARWLRKVDSGLGMAHAVLNPKPPVVVADLEPVEAIPEVAGDESEVAEADEDTPAPAPKPLEDFPMERVKEIAAGLGIAWKVGMKKVDLIAAIREKRSETITQEESHATD